MRKIIVTEWKNTTIINKNVVEEIKKLKEQSGQNILVAGSHTPSFALAHLL